MLGLGAIGDAPIGSSHIFRAYFLPAATSAYAYTGVAMPVLGGAGGAIIINTAEDVFTSGIVVAATSNLPISWQYSISPTTDNFTVSTSDNVLTVNYMSDDGLWLPMIIYLDNNKNLQTINNWSALPAPSVSPEITQMIVDPNNTKLWTLSVTATDSLMNVYTNTYTLKVEANYSINRDILVTQVSERQE